jgi:uncharacterized membrane protein
VVGDIRCIRVVYIDILDEHFARKQKHYIQCKHIMILVVVVVVIVVVIVVSSEYQAFKKKKQLALSRHNES